MDEERFIQRLVSLHEGLPRLGPGTDESTLKALSLCENLPPQPEILDVGCGTGAQALVLAANTDGHIVATDLHPTFLEQLEKAIVREGLEDRIEQGFAAELSTDQRQSGADVGAAPVHGMAVVARGPVS